MEGWLVVNSFIDSPKFKDLYQFFLNAADVQNVTLTVRTADALVCSLDSDFSGFHLPDFILFWDKDIYLAQRLEAMGIPVFNSAKGIEWCDNKILTALRLNHHVRTPKTVIAPKTFEGVNYCKKDFLKQAIRIVGLPVIIKEAYGSFGQQVYLADSFEAASLIVDHLKHKDFLMQEFIAGSRGRDVRINVVGEEAVAAMLRYNDTDFRSNISNGGKMQSYAITEAQREIAVKACQILGLDFAGVDVLFGQNGEPLICEVNSNPHFRSTFDCTGVDMSAKILNHIVRKLH